MNISSTTGISSLASVSSTSAVHAVSSTTDGRAAAEVGEPPNSSDKTRLSKLGELMSKLQDLESSDPAKAKQVLTSIASALTEKANSSTGSGDPHLQELADKFTEAASTGDLAGLRPSGGPHHHHREGPPPPSSGDATTAAAPTSSQTASYAQRGANQADQLASIISNALSGVAT